MEKIAVENINWLIFEGKAIPLAGVSSTMYKSNGGDSADLKDNTIKKRRLWWTSL